MTAGERDAFFQEVERADRAARTLCLTLAYARCRLSEALALTVDRVDLSADVLTFESLKKRRLPQRARSPLPCSRRATRFTADGRPRNMLAAYPCHLPRKKAQVIMPLSFR